MLTRRQLLPAPLMALVAGFTKTAEAAVETGETENEYNKRQVENIKLVLALYGKEFHDNLGVGLIEIIDEADRKAWNE